MLNAMHMAAANRSRFLAAITAAANAHPLPSIGDAAPEVGTMGAWGGSDVIGAAGLFDVVGDASNVATFANNAGRARLGNALAGVQAYNPSMVADAAQVLGRPLGLPPNSVFTAADGARVARKQYIGLGQRVTIAAGVTTQITAIPQSIARIERLVIESIGAAAASGRDFVVSRLDIGDMRQISGTGEIPGTAFAADGFQLDVKLDTSNPGNSVTIEVTNITGAPITVALVGIGTVVR